MGDLVDAKIIGGVALICIIIVVAGFLFYNFGSNKQSASNTMNNNITNDNTTNTSTNKLILTLFPDNQMSSMGK